MGTNIRSAADVFNQYFTERNRIRMGRFFFDLALVVELVLMNFLLQEEQMHLRQLL